MHCLVPLSRLHRCLHPAAFTRRLIRHLVYTHPIYTHPICTQTGYTRPVYTHPTADESGR